MISSLISTLWREEGQGIAEYALILAIMVLLGAAGFTVLGPAIRESVSSFANKAYNN